jgi:hypothetical protein
MLKRKKAELQVALATPCVDGDARRAEFLRNGCRRGRVKDLMFGQPLVHDSTTDEEALTGDHCDPQPRLEVGPRRTNPWWSGLWRWAVEPAEGKIARFNAIEEIAAGSMAARRPDIGGS